MRATPSWESTKSTPQDYHSVPSILFCHANSSHVLLYYIYESSLWSSSFFLLPDLFILVTPNASTLPFTFCCHKLPMLLTFSLPALFSSSPSIAVNGWCQVFELIHLHCFCSLYLHCYACLHRIHTHVFCLASTDCLSSSLQRIPPPIQALFPLLPIKRKKHD